MSEIIIKIAPERTETFLQLFQNMKLFTESVSVHFEKDRLFMQTMDSSHISVIELSLPKAWFTHYHIAKPTRIGFSVQLFSKILATRDKSGAQDISLEMKQSTDDKMSIYMRNNEAKEEKAKALVDKEFDMPLMELDTDMLSIPTQEYDAEFTLASSEFAELIQQLRIFGDTLTLECTETLINAHSISLDKGGMRGKIDIERLSSYAINEGETVKLSFSLTHLANIVAFHKIAQQVQVNVKANSPIMISYPLLLGTLNQEQEGNTYMRFYLAPKMEDDDE
jgi:proliferating cell nuclear antigen